MAARLFGLGQMLATRVETPSVATAGELRILPIHIDTPMDPRLQLAIANRRSGKPGLTLASTDADEVAVVARVTAPQAWEAIPDLLPGSMLGQVADGSWIVTGRVPIIRAEAIRNDPCVISMKAAQPVRPTLGATIAAMHVAAADLDAGTDAKGGRDVIVGIVDFGCDYLHGNFRSASGKTRIEKIWDQAGIAKPDSPFGYGRVHTAADIDAALATDTPYAALGYFPAPDNAAQVGTHGTHVMDIAAGNGLGSGQAGVAPEATLIFVEASTNDINWTGPDAVNQSFGDSVHLLEAVRYIFDQAGERPCVVNLSLGTNGGPHDGSSLVEQGLDALVGEKPGRAVVIAAGNSQADDIHTSGTVEPGADHDIAWLQNSEGGGEFELWYPGARSLQVTLVAPDGTQFGPLSHNDNLPIGANGRISIFISSRQDDPNNHDNMIGIYLAERMSTDPWLVRLRSLDEAAVDYHAWIERMDGSQSAFANPVPTHNLGSISTGHQSIVVGCYDAHKPSFPLSSFSSTGPTRDGRDKPEVSAPGQNVVAARSRTGNGVTRKSGTSMAAPAVTGLVALILAEAAGKGLRMTVTELRERLIKTTLGNPPPSAPAAWDARYGFGRADGGAIA
ncbi:S8 family serine peptidase [uncultured Sphingomonas sp.]|uniref:S8 family serine peptidase n=1 Tax=uncultured Sphingomonas sp. TaxID=158754 RepID=UPI0035C9B7B2